MVDRCKVALNVASGAASGLQVRLVSQPEWEQRQLDPGLLQHGGLMELTRFRGEEGESLAVPQADGLCWLLGIGSEWTPRAVRRAAASATNLIKKETAWSFSLPPGRDRTDLLAAAVEGIGLGSYRYQQTCQSATPLGTGTIVVPEEQLGAARTALQKALAVVEGTLLTRDLVNTPAMDLGPEELAEAAVEVGKRHGLEATTYRGEELWERGFRMVEAVGRASSRPPTLTVLESSPGTEPELALIGKGVVFDTGGVNLKPGRGMLLMRKDMGGAATVLGVVDALGRLAHRRNLLVVIPAAENSVGSRSYRPGDILKAYDGTTVEIGNTDAEGRLLLGDSLAFARERNSKRMLDVATLTGAARVALGPEYPALFGNDEVMVETLLNAGKDRDEPLWRMPLIPEYREWLKTPFADVNHVSSDARAGAITAALFLERFAGDVPWSHIDVYGWEDKGKPDIPKGANGMTVRAVTEAVMRLPAE